MTAATRIVSIGFLTFFLMGLTELFTKGQFVVPFPFITEFSAVMALAIAASSFRQKPLLYGLLIAYALTGIVSGRFLWETVLDFDALVALFESGWIDLLRLVHYLLLMSIMAIGFSVRQSWYRLFIGILLLSLVVLIFQVSPEYLFVWYFLWGVCNAVLLARSPEDFMFQRVSLFFVGVGVLNLMALATLLLAR